MKAMKIFTSSKLSMADLHREMIAGLTLAALAIPEVMAYTKIAGTSVITGLYTMLIPVILFALIGSSRHLVVGADSATAAMLAVGLAGMAAVGSNEYVALAGVLALLSAVLLLIARFFRLGFLANFLSRTVLIGFLTGVGVQVALTQIAPMLGVHGPRHGSFFSIAISWWQIEGFHPLTITLSLTVLAIIIICRRISHAIPGPLIAVVIAISFSWAFHLDRQGVAILGEIPSGLPHIALPDIAWSWALIS
ncbi:MAG: SulP family inorganic anion transporter, partial [Phycisphaerales bacterium]|nr:SulP family inorganic anion transporter [Phycisphaerales bacterium]